MNKEAERTIILLREEFNKGFQKGKQEAKSQFLEMLDEDDFKKRISSIIAGNYALKSTEKRDLIIKWLKSQLTKGDEK